MGKLHKRKIGGRTVLFYGSTAIPEFAYSLLPWALILRLQWRKERLGLYSSWDAARSAADAYDDRQLNAFRAARATSYRPDGSTLHGTTLGLAVKALGRNDLAVVDFGGSTGELGTDFLSAFPEANYTVVENQTLVQLMQGRTGGPMFAATIPTACDIFFTSGTLQYLDDPMAVLDAGFTSARHAVILARNSFCDRPLFRVQKTRMFENGGGPIPEGFEDADITYPHRTIREADVFNLADRRGFECVARLEEQSGAYAYQGEVYGKQLVFMRKQRQA